jgi:hypothetical protein
MAVEIGHQGKMFQGALEVYVWLFTHSPEAVYKKRDALEAEADSWPFEYDWDLGVSALVTEGYIEFLLSDPWFSSPWTLQEAFLRQDAILLAPDGTRLRKTHPWVPIKKTRSWMGAHGLSWVVMGFHGFSWVFMGFHGFSWFKRIKVPKNRNSFTLHLVIIYPGKLSIA